MAKNTFNTRKAVSLILLVTLIIMPVSAIAVHATHGSAINHVWLHIHVFFGVVFVIAGIYHSVFRWKIIKYYLTGQK